MKALKAILVTCLVAVTTPSFAAFTFAGSWNVNDGPSWQSSPPNGPLAYTAQEAAALLFGGNASDYAISTLGSDSNLIDHMAWYDVIGVGENLFAEDYSNKYLGLYYGPTNGYNCCGGSFALVNAASAFVSDNTSGLTNYAFRISNDVPEPGSLVLLSLGLVGLGVAGRKKKIA